MKATATAWAELDIDKNNTPRRQPRRAMGVQATMATLMSMMTVLPAHKGNGEHMMSLGGDGAAATLEERVCGLTTADEKNQIRIGPAGEPVRERGGTQRARFQI